MSSLFEKLYYNHDWYAPAKATVHGRNGQIYINGGTTPVATAAEWTLEVNRDRYWGDPLWKVPPEIVAEGVAKPEPDIAWLRRRIDEICWIPA